MAPSMILVESLFAQALSMPARERPRFLTTIEPLELRAEVEDLLERNEAGEALALDLEGAVNRVADALFGEPSDPRVGEQIGRFEVRSVLGDGSCARVYLAFDPELQREVAIKVLRASSRASTDRFLNEARAISALNHPHIGAVHEIGETPQRERYIVMPRYTGCTLAESLKDGPMSTSKGVEIGIQLADALCAAHAAGIVHRDVKAANVIFESDDSVRLLDFGIAKLAQAHQTEAGVILGTVAYMSPEQTQGSDVDPRTDVWSLGVLLYEMLTGRKPFDGDEAEAVIHQIRHDEPPGLASLPRGLRRTITVALAKDPNERFASMRELLEALTSGDRMRSGSDAQVLRLFRRLRANRLAASVASLVVVAAAGAYLLVPGVQAPVAADLLWWQATPSVQEVVATGRVEVLPFDVLTDDPEARRFNDGLGSNLRRALATGGVETAAGNRPTAGGIPRATAELALEGSVDRDLDRLLVTAHIVHQQERVILWSSQFRRDTREGIDLQSQVASEAAHVIRCGLASRAVQPERTTTRLFALFLQSCSYMGSGDENEQVKLHELAQRIVAEAPDLAMAQALYAVASIRMSRTSFAETLSPAMESYVATARRAAERALEIDPDNGTAHWALAMTYSGDPAQWTRFESHLRNIKATDPSFSYALYHLMWLARATGRLGEAIDLQRSAAELDPYSPYKTAALTWLLAMSGALPEADLLLTSAEALWPNARELADYRLQIALWYRPPDVAEEVLRNSVSRLGITDAGVACRRVLLDARRGHRVEPEDLRRTCSDSPRGDFVSRVLALVGDVDGAYREMARMDFSGFGDTIFLFFPEMRIVRHDPRFMRLAQRAGLVDYWRNTDRWPDFCADFDLPYDCRQVVASLGNPAASGVQ